MGSAVDRQNIRRELERYRAAGFGGVHIIPIYGAKGYEKRFVAYLSPNWMELLKFTVAEAARLDMGVDMTLGTGWCFGGPNISGNNACAVVVHKAIQVKPDDVLADPFSPTATHAAVAYGADGRVVDITSKIRADRSIDWVPKDVAWTIFFASQEQCSVPVKRAAPGGEGPMLNPFYRPAIDRYLVRFSEAFRNYDGKKPRAVYQDSFEYGGNWSPDFFEQFTKLRGYRLQDHLDVLFVSENSERTARVKSDYRETMADLLLDNVTRPWIDWAHTQKFLTRNEAHGSPGNWLDLYAVADVPETEMFRNDRSILVSKFSSSAAHVAGRRLSSSESGTWLSEHFQERLEDLKLLMDDLFLSGVNHIFFHGTAYSPDDAPWPGWLFYASTEMNPRNSIWRDVPALAAYITRTQSVLQTSRPDNDLLLYWPIYDYWHNSKGLGMNFTIHSLEGSIRDTPFGRLARELWKAGFAFDYISDRQISEAKARGTAILVPGGSYKAVLVPATQHMPLGTVRKLIQLARDGATVVFESLPADVPGWKDFAGRRDELHGLVEAIGLRDDRDIKVAAIGIGKILVGEAGSALKAAGIRREEMVAARPGLSFVRLRSDGLPTYFLVNASAAIDGWVPLRANTSAVLMLDPMSGKFGRAVGRRVDSSSEIYLQMQPGQSLIVRFESKPNPRAPIWQYRSTVGPARELKGEWTVEFISGGPERPPLKRLSQLRSWTELGEAAERFAGTARYTLTFDVPAPASVHGWELDLGSVRESARIRLNGEDLGTMLMPPYRVWLSRLKPAGNELQVEVTNLSANRIRDLDRRGIEWRKFYDINFVNVDYKKFDASQWPLLPSGLLGPVTITPSRSFSPLDHKQE